MISVDDRIGSIELIPNLRHLASVLIRPSSKIPIPVISSARLLSGDACFDGKGRDSCFTSIGIERKRLHDMINSIRTGRYSGRQLPDMLDYYDHCYLIIEGYYRCGPEGELETLITHADPLGHNLGGRWMPVEIGRGQQIRFFELDHFVSTMETHTRVHIRRTSTDWHTAAEILSIYTHHQKDPADHHSHEALHQPQTYATLGKAGLVRRVAACMYGIGWERSAAVALKFSTVYDMVMAGPEEWRMPGIGKVLANRAFDQLRGKYKPEGEED